MRTYFVRNVQSIFYGEYIIYDNVKEAKASGIETIKWYSPEIEKGDWIEADDGGVLQCINKRKLKNIHDQITYLYRFCNGMVAVFYGKGDYPKRIQQLYAFYTKPNKSKITDQPRMKDVKIIAVAKLIAAGIPVVKACYQAFPESIGRYFSPQKVLDIITNPLFKEVIMSETNNFISILKETWTPEKIAKEYETIYQELKGKEKLALLEKIERMVNIDTTAESLPAPQEPKRLKKGHTPKQIENVAPPC